MKISKLPLIIVLSANLYLVQSSQRTFTLTNKCSYPVWFAFAGGSVNARNSASTTCGGDGDCYEGSACVTTGNIRQCFVKNPEPEDGDYELSSNQSKDVHIPIYDNGSDIIWSGLIGGRTNCNEATCETADCGGGNKGCKASQGLFQPATQAEFTLLKSTIDFYDVEIINGVNIPVSMAPSNTPSGGSSDPYKCGAPGSHSTCSWSFSPPSNDYIWVSAGGNTCQSDSDCSDSQCGISFNPGHQDLFMKTCGKQLGYWTADQICGVIPSYGAPFDCAPYLSLYQCVGIGSCYQQGAASNCCGCANWDQEGLNVPPAPYTEQCKNQNPVWRDQSLSKLKWLKSGCPSAYTYPYDDMSSTFTCYNQQNGVNSVNYEVTFCPNNISYDQFLQ